MAVKILNGIDVEGSMNIVASDVPNLDASKITSGTFSADRIPTGLYQPAGDYLDLETANTTFQPIGNYLTSVPSEYLTQTEGDARYLTSLPSHNHDTLYDAIGSANAVSQQVNQRIDTEVFDAIGNVAGSIPTNNNQLTNGAGYITSSSLPSSSQLVKVYNNVNYVPSGDANQRGNYGQGVTVYEGYSGGTNRPFTYDTTAQFMSTTQQGFEISVDWVSNSSTPMKVRHLRDCCQGWSPWINIWTEANFTGTNISNWNTAYGWGNHASAGYLTSLPSHNHDTLYDSLGSAAAVSTALNERIDTEVFGAIGDVAGTIPTNNNQLTNGAGYITAVPSSFTTTNITATGYIKGGGQQLVLSAGEAQNYATGQTAEYIYMNAEQGLEINSDTGNWAGGWAARKTAYLRGDQLTLDGETLTKTNIQNFKTAYGWGNHASAGYLTSIPSTYATDAEVGTAVGVVDARINDEVIPYIDVVAADASKGAVAHGWGDHSAAGYLTSLPAHNHDSSYDPVGSADAVALQVNTRIDQEVIPSIPVDNNQLLNGAGYITAVPSSFSTNSIAIGNGVTLSESTDRADLLMIKSSTSTWGGLQISNTSNEIIFSMMGDGNVIGLYDDLNNDWIIQRDENGSMRFYADASNTVTVTTSGLSVTGAITASGDVTAFSDARVKENVETISNALESVKQMRGVTYNKIGEEKRSVGVIAQELEEVVPQLVHTDEEGMKSVAYGNITAVLIEAVKELTAKVESLEEQLKNK